MVIYIKRVVFDDDNTWGVLYMPNYACYTIERSWKNNIPFNSCIPEGMYFAEKYQSSRLNKALDGWAIRLKNVPNRTAIAIHIANYASQLYGCIAPGTFTGDNNVGSRSVHESTESMTEILALLPDTEFAVIIENIKEV